MVLVRQVIKIVGKRVLGFKSPPLLTTLSDSQNHRLNDKRN